MTEDAMPRRTRRRVPEVGRGGRADGSRAATKRPHGVLRQASQRRGQSLTRRPGHIDLARYVTAIGPALRRGLDSLLAPRHRPTVRLAQPPVASAADLPAMLETFTAAVRGGNITASEAAALSQIADIYTRALGTSEFDRRLRVLEAAAHAKS